MIPTLKPLFAPTRDLVGWLLPGRFVFSADTAYLAFIVDGHAWSASTGNWVGPIVGDTVHDLDGLPVAWTVGSPVRSIGKPAMPMRALAPTRPVRPVRPVNPLRPLGTPTGVMRWSQLSFLEWANGGPFPVEPEPEVETESEATASHVAAEAAPLVEAPAPAIQKTSPVPPEDQAGPARP